MDKFLPTSRKELEALGYNNVDVILFSGDAYVDHPAFGPAVIGRVLEAAGFRVALVPQPNWRDDLRDFTKLGRPRLFFGVSAGNMDSMVNHYTAAKRLRRDDAYTPGGKAGMRPDYAATVYARILKQLYPDVPVVLGGIEASLRRLTHYDYWSNRLLPSVLISSGADFLVYGMGERPMVALAQALRRGEDPRTLPQLSYVLQPGESLPGVALPDGRLPQTTKAGGAPVVALPSHEECVANKVLFAKHFHEVERCANTQQPPVLTERVGPCTVVVNPPYPLMTTAELDAVYELPFTYKAHWRYKDKPIAALSMIQFSVCLHRGCFGGCSFCTIAAHQGRHITSRSEASVLRQIARLSQLDTFKGYLTDLGGPSANMYRMEGKNKAVCARCVRTSCLFPAKCANLDASHGPLLELYEKVRALPYIKKATIGSGVRYDLFLDANGFLNAQGAQYFETLLQHHVSGRLKVAPEHTQPHVLRCMNKPPFALYEQLHKVFKETTRRQQNPLQLVPYFISSHPACTLRDMELLAGKFAKVGLYVDQVQDFTPTPMTKSSVMFATGLDPDTLEKVFVERAPERKVAQKEMFFRNKRKQSCMKN